MKKTKMLVLTLVLAVMLAGAGYAAWTDNIQITNSLATGEFKVLLQTGFQRVNLELEKGEKDQTIALGKEASSYNLEGNSIHHKIKDNTIDFAFKNLYPGATATTMWSLSNAGTINAVIESVDVDIVASNGSELIDQMLVNGSVYRRPDATKAEGQKSVLSIKNIKLSELESLLNKQLQGVELKPNEGLDFGEIGEGSFNQIHFEVPTELTGDVGENETINVSIKFNFVQPNMFNGTRR